MRQYEIWWARLPEPIGRRPVLLLTRTPAYRYLSKVIVVEITTIIRGIPVELSLGKREGLGRRSVANFDNLHVVARATLQRRIGMLHSARVDEAKRCLGWALDWPELKHPGPDVLSARRQHRSAGGATGVNAEGRPSSCRWRGSIPRRRHRGR